MSSHRPEISRSSEDDHTQEKSKSQRKRDMLALQDLALALCNLSSERLSELPLTETLADAIVEMKRVRSHEGKRRHAQYLGKLMRALDEAAITAIRLEVEKLSNQHQTATAQFHHLERWRTELLENDQAMTSLLQQYPNADAQMLRTLIRNARKEIAKHQPGHNFRELFRMLKRLEQPADQLD